MEIARGRDRGSKASQPEPGWFFGFLRIGKKKRFAITAFRCPNCGRGWSCQQRSECTEQNDHAAEVHVAMADGSVRFLRTGNRSPEELQKLLQIGGFKEDAIGESEQPSTGSTSPWPCSWHRWYVARRGGEGPMACHDEG